MQYKVPQNVDIEDRVIGPLTLRQFTVIAFAGGILLVLYFIFRGPLRIIFWMLAIIIGSTAAIIAFAKYGDQNFEIFALGALKTLSTPRKRVWKKLLPQNQNVEEVKKVTAKELPKKRELEEVRDDFQKLAEIVDSGGNIALTPKDRIIPFGIHIEDKNVATDILSLTENKSTLVDPLIEQATKNVVKKEPLLSEIASVSPNQKFEYPSIEIKDRRIKRF